MGLAVAEQFYAFFGSRGLYCYDHDGTLLWKRDLGDLQIPCSSEKVRHRGCTETRSLSREITREQFFITALDKRTGEERWRADRDEITSWTAPLVVMHGGEAQVVTSAPIVYGATTWLPAVWRGKARA